MNTKSWLACALAFLLGYLAGYAFDAYARRVQSDLAVLGTVQHCQQMPDECDGSGRRQE